MVGWVFPTVQYLQNRKWCCRPHTLVWVAHAGGTSGSPQAGCSSWELTPQDQALWPSFISVTMLSKVMICTASFGVVPCIITTFISTWQVCTSLLFIYWVIFRKTQVSDALLKNLQAFDILSLILTSQMLMYIGISCNSPGPGPPLMSTANWFLQAYLQKEWKLDWGSPSSISYAFLP